MTKGQLEAKLSEAVSFDISTKTGEKIIIITTERNIEELVTIK